MKDEHDDDNLHTDRERQERNKKKRRQAYWISEQRMRLFHAIVLLIFSITVGLSVVATIQRPVYASTPSCSTLLDWPIHQEPRPTIVQEFSPPPAPWLAGHRGVDLEAATGTPLFPPADGILHFAGAVGGKDVVSIELDDGMIATFEPATTDFKVGAKITRSRRFATVDGRSDHCSNLCVHWGMKKGDTYYDPVEFVTGTKIVLKPVAP
jgi:hypothetical protein